MNEIAKESVKVEFPGFGWSFDISKEAFNLFGITVHWYGILIALGVALAMVFAFRKAKGAGLDVDRMIDVVIGGTLGAIVGARLYFVLFKIGDFSDNWLEIFYINEGGIAIYGAIIGAFATGILMCKWRKVKMLPMFDLTAMGFLIGQCIGRWGNFVNVEAYGSPTMLPWRMESVKIADELLLKQGTAVHPTFFYESLWCLLGFLALSFYYKRRRYDGEVFLMYLSWYSFGRFFIEGLRTDSLELFGQPVSQMLSALIFLASVAIMLIVRVKIKEQGNNPEYLKLYVNTDESKELLREKEEKLKESKKTPKRDELDKTEMLVEDETVVAEESFPSEEEVQDGDNN